jgi:predicted methyltransferase
MLLGGSSFSAHAQSSASDAIKAAIADPARPQSDRTADGDRKPAELIAFAGIKPGDKILELIPGRGYFLRIFSKLVGPSGHVYELVPEEETKRSQKGLDAIKAIAKDPAYKNVTVLVQPVAALKVPEQVDFVWTSQNYHDLHDKGFGPADMTAFNKAVFAALKPGGVFLITDHAAQAGSGVRDTETLHRIDPAAVKSEVQAAGFAFEAESDVLKESGDDHTLKVFDPKTRGKTDKFVLRFRKPR